MVRPVIQDYAKVDHGIPGKIALRRGVQDTFLHRGDEIPGNRTAKNVIYELESGTARARLHLDPAVPVLAVAACLLLVLALCVRLSAYGLTVGDLGRFQRDLDVEPALQLGYGYLHVLLPGPGNQEIFGLRVA